MTELLRNAWQGWLSLSASGKLVGALIAVLLTCFFWKLGEGRQKTLRGYAAVMAVLCICPLSAAALMLWQTSFYDYEWIWILVPVTGMTACGVVLVLEKIRNGTWRRMQKLLAGAMILCLLLLCGGYHEPQWAVRDLARERKEISAVLKTVQAETGKEIVLWAPREVIAQARSLAPEIRLLYGRNMWQGHLNAFSYDGYDQDRRDLYVWMIMIGRYGKLDVPVATDIEIVGERLEAGGQMEGLSCVRKAAALGVNRILLPGNMSGEALDTLRTELPARVEQVGNYWLIYLDGE